MTFCASEHKRPDSWLATLQVRTCHDLDLKQKRQRWRGGDRLITIWEKRLLFVWQETKRKGRKKLYLISRPKIKRGVNTSWGWISAANTGRGRSNCHHRMTHGVISIRKSVLLCVFFYPDWYRDTHLLGSNWILLLAELMRRIQMTVSVCVRLLLQSLGVKSRFKEAVNMLREIYLKPRKRT